MTESPNSGEKQTSILVRLKSALKKVRFDDRSSLKKAIWTIIVLSGAMMAGYGQFMLSVNMEGAVATPLGRWLNESLRVDVPQIDYVLRGLGFLLAGVGLLLLVFRYARLFGREEQTGWHVPATVPPIRSINITVALCLLGFFFLIIQVSGNTAPLGLTIVWLTTMLAGLIAAAQIDIRSGTPLSPNIKQIDALWLTGLLLAGLLVGIYRLNAIPNQLMGDEGDFWGHAKSLAIGTYTPLPSPFGLGVYSYSILSSYYQALVLKIFGVTFWSWRFSSVLAGVAAILPLYLLARELFDRRIAALSTVVMMTSAYYLAFSRLGYNNIHALFPVSMALYLGYIGVKRSSAFYLLAAGLFAGFSFYTYTAGRSALVILGIFLLFLLIRKPSRFKNLAAAGSILLCGWLLCATPHLVYGNQVTPDSINHKMDESIFLNRDFARSVFSEEEINASDSIFFGEGDRFVFNPRLDTILLSRGVLRTLLAYHIPNLVTEHFITSPLAGNVGAPFYALGLFAVLFTLRERRSLILLAWFLVSVIALSAANTFPPRQSHMVTMIPLMAILTARGLALTASAIAHVWERAARPIGSLILAIGIGAVALNGMYDYFIRVPQVYFPLFEEAINWRGLYNPERQFIYVYSDPARAEFKPFIFRVVLPDIRYEAVSLDNLPQRLTRADENTVVFFETNIGNTAAFQVSQAWPSASGTILSTREGLQLGSVYAGRPMVTPATQSFVDILKDSYARPAMWVLLLPVLALALLAWLNARRVEKLPQWIRSALAWLSQDPSGLDEGPKPNPAATLFPPILARFHKTKLPVPSEPAEPAPAVALVDQAPASPAPADVNEQAPKRQRFIEFELRLRINLDNAPWQEDDSPAKHPTWLRRVVDWWKRLGTGQFAWDREMPVQAVWLLIPLVLAFAAQGLISNRLSTAGIVLYALAVVGLSAWLFWRRADIPRVLAPAILGRRAELLLLVGVMLIAVIARFYNAGNFPYGIEGDESKWGLQAYYSTILGEERGVFLHHFEHQPVSFYLIGGAMRVSGINLMTPRYLNALLSCLSVLLLYLIARRATGSPLTALLSTFLYATSFTALSAGRQALHDTHTEFWINLTFFLLLVAIERKNDWFFLLTGLSALLAIATYETAYPILGVIVLILFVMWLKNKGQRWAWTWYAVLTVLPILIYIPTIISYIEIRQSFHLGNLRMSTEGGNGGLVQFFTTNLLDSITMLFSHIVWPDSLLRWEGPLVNPWILPFFVIGLVVSLFLARRVQMLLVVLWFALCYFPFSILGADFPRVVYAAVMAIYLLSAIGLAVCLSTILSAVSVMEVKKLSILTASFFAFLIFLAGTDISIFTTRLLDANDRRMRRELLDIFAPSLGNDGLVYLPTIPSDADVIEVEKELLYLTSQGKAGLTAPQASYQIVPFNELLANISNDRTGLKQATILFDKETGLHREVRQLALTNVLSCFPDYQTRTGKYFDSYTIDLRQTPRCTSILPPTLTAPPPGAVLDFGQPIHFEWGQNWQAGLQPKAYRLIVERQNPQIYWIEAENLQGNGWYSEATIASNFSGSGYLVDGENSSPTLLNINLLESGRYDLWVRTYRRMINDQHNYIALDMFPAREISLTGESTFSTWVWEKVGTYDLKAGAHALALSRTYGSDPQFSVFIDAIVLSDMPAYDPGRMDIWTVVHDSGQQPAGTEYTLMGNLQPGTYRWRLVLLGGDLTLVDWDGQPGVKSGSSIFQIMP